MSVKNPITTNKQTPAMQSHSWRFGDLTAAELLPWLQQQLLDKNPNANWQLVWLNNNGKPVIGLLPKVAWHVYPSKDERNTTSNGLKSDQNPVNYQVSKIYRDTLSIETNKVIEYLSYEAWQQQLITYCQAQDTNDSLNLNSAIDISEPYYHHGLIGFIGYDIAAQQLSSAVDISSANQPLAVLAHYDIYLSLTNTETQNTTEPNNVNSERLWSLITKSNGKSEPALTDDNLTQLVSYLDQLDRKLNDHKARKYSQAKKRLAPLLLKLQWQKSDYQQAFRQTQDYLEQGDCYQINLTQAWQGHFEDSDNLNDSESTAIKLIEYLPALQQNTQAPFAGYLSISDTQSDDTQNTNFELLSCSPELFFTFAKSPSTHTHHIITKPIKGTIPRGKNAQQDLTHKQQLIASDKDRSENVMIVDLLRNDLGKYAKTGTVKVPKLFEIESFSNVHHMVSTITAELKADTHPLSVLFGSLPAGSITGTPKKRAVEIIAELEAAPRGAYCGTMGYMNFDGSGQWNVLIRTLQATSLEDGSKLISLWAGGGITIASDCDAEYQECLDKVGNLLNVLAQADSK